MHLAPVHQVCRLSGAGALREHLLNPFGEPKKVRACPSGFLTIDHFGLRHGGLASASSAASMLWERPSAAFASGAGCAAAAAYQAVAAATFLAA